MCVFQFATSVLCLIAIIVAFWSPVASWCILAVPLAFFSLTLWSLRRRPTPHVTELSTKANEMLSKFGHYYHHHFAGGDISASASTVSLSASVVAIIGCFYGFWWGIGIWVVVALVGGFLSRQFNPTNFLLDEAERRAHEEIIAWLSRKKIN